MQKSGLSGLKCLDHYKSLSGAPLGSTKAFTVPSRISTDSLTSGSFASLKLTAEKLVKEQASVKSDLEMANTKLNKSIEHIRILEEKLQNAFNENAKLKVKQKEDEKLWKGLESKFTSTKTLCDQLTETLQHLAGHVQDAEKDKELFEEKVSASTQAIDVLNQQMNDLSLKLEVAEETIRNRERELKELTVEKDKMEEFHGEEHRRNANIIKERDAHTRQLEASLAARKSEVESLNSKLAEILDDLRMKDNELNNLSICMKNTEKEKNDLQSGNEDFANKLATSLREIQDLKDLVQHLAANLIELDRQSLSFSDKFVQLKSVYNTSFQLVQQEKYLASKLAQKQYDNIHDQFLRVTSDKDVLLLFNQQLNQTVVELHNAQQSLMVQHAEDCRLREEKIQRLESDGEALISKKSNMELLINELELKNSTLSGNLSLSESKLQDLSLRLLALESANKDMSENLQADIQKKTQEISTLEKEIVKQEQQADLVEKEKRELYIVLDEKEQKILQCKEREKKLEDNKEEIHRMLVAAENQLEEAKKQHDMMLESKQSELSRHLKEISQKNDQAINDIRRKYEMEKLEIVNQEKEKAENTIAEMERNCDKKLVECKEESKQYLLHIQEEHATLITHIQQEHERKELSLKADHCNELKRIELQAEIELREKTKSLRNEYEVQIKTLKCQHEDECKRLDEELELQKSKEDRQRALLQLQWKVMGDKPEEEQEVNSRKNYSILSKQTKISGGTRRSQCAPVDDNNVKGSPFLSATQTPVSNFLKKVETVNTGSLMNIPKHRRKVTHHEYEVETSNGTTITKRRKTKSTVMFGDPRKNKSNTPKANYSQVIAKGAKGAGNPHPSNIGDLFSEGSLNPYTDDPYAFD